MRVLVTGHLGYLGTVLVPVLLDAGHAVVGLDSDLYAGCTFTDGIVSVPELRLDLRDVDAGQLAGFDAVVHLAALSNDPLGDLDPELTDAINGAGSVRLAQLAKSAAVSRFIFFSSCSSYGAAGDGPVDEQADLRPLTPYALSKVYVERELSKLADDRFSPVFLRNATAYGVSPRLRCDLVLNDLVGWAFTTGRVVLRSDGTAWRPIVHAADIARACTAALAAPADVVRAQAFNVGSTDQNYRIRDLAEIVAETVPGARVEYAEGAAADKRSYRVNFDKIARLLPDFVPCWNARAGARELYEAYRRNGLTPEDFQGPRYRRVDRIRSLSSSGEIDASLRRRGAAAAAGNKVAARST